MIIKKGFAPIKIELKSEKDVDLFKSLLEACMDFGEVSINNDWGDKKEEEMTNFWNKLHEAVKEF